MEELAIIYSSLALADDDIPITEDKLTTMLKTAGISVESFWLNLYCKALKNVNIKDLLSSVGSIAQAPPQNTQNTDAEKKPVESKKEEKAKESEPESEDDDMGLSLFD